MGSGSTGMAAKDEWFDFIGIEKKKNTLISADHESTDLHHSWISCKGDSQLFQFVVRNDQIVIVSH